MLHKTSDSKTSKALLIDPDNRQVTVIDLEHRNDDGLTHIRELLDTLGIDAAPRHPITDDLLIVSDMCAVPKQINPNTFSLSYVSGSIVGKGLLLGADISGKAIDVKITVEQISKYISWEAN